MSYCVVAAGAVELPVLVLGVDGVVDVPVEPALAPVCGVVELSVVPGVEVEPLPVDDGLAALSEVPVLVLGVDCGIIGVLIDPDCWVVELSVVPGVEVEPLSVEDGLVALSELSVLVLGVE